WEVEVLALLLTLTEKNTRLATPLLPIITRLLRSCVSRWRSLCAPSCPANRACCPSPTSTSCSSTATSMMSLWSCSRAWALMVMISLVSSTR
ncbi:hypothetical protein FOZ63_027827, partial [Perkinsus olseni]